MRNDKMMTDLHRLLETQDFKTKEDLQKFMDGLMGQKIPSFPKEALNAKEQAQDLIFEAMELDEKQGVKKAKKALELDPDCIEAYEYLGSIEITAEKAMVHHLKGIEIGRRIFGGKYLKKYKGMFWGMHETRPFMLCLQRYADCLNLAGKTTAAVKIFEELIELNPNDNQGVRDHLLLNLLVVKEFDKFKKYAKQYDDDAMAFSLYTKALFAFITEGESANALKELKKALNSNKFVAKKIMSKTGPLKLPSQHGFGDEDEADYYVCFSYHVWHTTTGAIQWLSKNC